MTSVLLLLAGQTLAAPAFVSVTPPKTSPSIYALVFIAKRLAREKSGRNPQMAYAAAHCRYDREMLATIVRANTIVRLKVVKQQKDAQDWLEKSLRVESLEDSGVLRISLADGSPAEQVVIVNAVAKAYVQKATERIRKRHEDAINSDSKDCAGIRERVRHWEAKLASLSDAKPTDIRDVERIRELRNGWISLVKDLRKQWKELETRIHERQEYLRTPYVILLESAELPPKAK